jgi:hypothetical protein
MPTTYRVILQGVTAGQDAGAVGARLGELFRLPADKVNRLLSKSGTTVKRGIDFQTAVKYHAALVGAGCDVTVVPEDAGDFVTEGTGGVERMPQNAPSSASAADEPPRSSAATAVSQTAIEWPLMAFAQRTAARWRGASVAQQAVAVTSALVICVLLSKLLLVAGAVASLPKEPERSSYDTATERDDDRPARTAARDTRPPVGASSGAVNRQELALYSQYPGLATIVGLRSHLESKPHPVCQNIAAQVARFERAARGAAARGGQSARHEIASYEEGALSIGMAHPLCRD